MHVCVEALGKDGDLSHVAMGRALGVRPEAISRWTTKYPEFRQWVGEQIDRLAGEGSSALLMRCLKLGLRGSVQHAELYLKAKRLIGSEQPAAGPVQVNIVQIPQATAMQAWPGGFLEAPK